MRLGKGPLLSKGGGVYMSAADVVKESKKKKRAGLGSYSASFQLSAPLFFSSFLNIEVFLLCWASQLREHTCVQARQAKREWYICSFSLIQIYRSNF